MFLCAGNVDWGGSVAILFAVLISLYCNVNSEYYLSVFL